MADVSRTVEVDILGRDKTGPATQSAAKNLDKVDKKSKDQAKGFVKLAGSAERMFGRMRQSSERWSNSNDKSSTRFAGRMLSGLASVAEGAAKFGGKFAGSISGALEAAGPTVKAAAVALAIGAAAVMAPAIGAAISSGVLLGVGGGILAVGIMRAVKDPKVAAAWKGFGATASKSLAGFAEPFKAPLIRAAATFSAAIKPIGAGLKGLGVIVAPVIDKLAPAIATFAQKLLPGLKAAAQAAMPLFDTLAAHMPKIGEAVSSFFSSIAAEGPSANLFFDHLLTGIELTIKGLGKVIAWLTSMYTVAVQTVQRMIASFAWLARGVLNALELIVTGAANSFSWVPGLGPKLQAAAAKFAAFRDSVNAKLRGIEDKNVTVTVTARYQNFNAGLMPQGSLRSASGRQFAAESSFATADPGAGTSRTGGPATVDVQSNVNVSLDGAPFYAVAVTATRQSERRQAWRLQVGTR